jgi:hypothetical protein
MRGLRWGEDIEGEAVNGQQASTVLAERRLVPRELGRPMRVSEALAWVVRFCAFRLELAQKLNDSVSESVTWVGSPRTVWTITRTRSAIGHIKLTCKMDLAQPLFWHYYCCFQGPWGVYIL